MGIDQARAGLAEWASGGDESVYSMAAEFGASRESVEADPLSILPRWNDFISRRHLTSSMMMTGSGSSPRSRRTSPSC
jgi:hypothetical protein